MIRAETTTDQQLLALDLDAFIADGLAAQEPEQSRRLFAEGAVAAAIRADAADVLPRSLTFLAEIIRRGGIAYAAGLPDALPTPEQARLAQKWIAAALPTGEASIFARWLDAVAAVVEVRRSARPI
jgi:hypothetical protein